MKVDYNKPFWTDELTKRQLEILELINQGLTDEEIAQKLFIVKSTVKTHKNYLYNKLKVNNKLSLVLKAQRLGLIRNPMCEKCEVLNRALGS